ncbi:MAG: PrgI family protein [Lachnospiraceae bacterium]|nr:PrgI family protein [Lachnospiraceae bacterium]
MAYVSVPKDLTKVKSKVMFNLTKRQVVCLGTAAALGLPFYFLTKAHIGTSNAATGMVLLMLPAFFFAMYEKDGLPFEKLLLNMLSVKLFRPAVRRYEVENLYEGEEEISHQKQGKGGRKHGKKKQK